MYPRFIGIGMVFILVFFITITTAGCTSPVQPSGPVQGTPEVTPTPLSEALIKMPNLTVVVVTPNRTTVIKTVNDTLTKIPPAEINARITDARNQLDNLIDSDVADTIIVHPDGQQKCDIKKTRELGYQIDTMTGESTFAKGGYWSLDSSLFSHIMVKDRDYIIIHTHPKTWKYCPGSKTVSANTFSIGDLETAESLTRNGFHIRKMIAIADGRDYRIWPGKEDGWRSDSEIQSAIKKIEKRLEQPFSHYDPILDQKIYDVDNLMPYLAKELNYTYTINNNVIT